MIRFEVLGIPKAQKRAKFARQGDFVKTYDPSGKDKQSMAAEIKGFAPRIPIDEPIAVKIEFYMPRPQSHFGSGKNASLLKPNAPLWCSGKPDLDNMVKYITDVMNSVFYRDDALIFWITANKRYSLQPKTKVCIETLTEISGDQDKNAIK
jgi:Holliday junction resolvase RusA-like endonuclease